MKPARPAPSPNTPSNNPDPDRRQLARDTVHRTTGSRAPVMPAERTDQPRKHGRHRGKRDTG